VGERPLDGALTELAVALGDVGAAAVLEVAREGVVVVAVDRREAQLLDPRAHLVRVGAVADEVAAADQRIDVERLDGLKARLERGEVAVDVGDDRDAVEAAEARRGRRAHAAHSKS
jgi:hypothetical protein